MKRALLSLSLLSLYACAVKAPDKANALGGSSSSGAEVSNADSNAGNGTTYHSSDTANTTSGDTANSTTSQSTSGVQISSTTGTGDESVSPPGIVTGAPANQTTKKSSVAQVVDDGRYYLKSLGTKKCMTPSGSNRKAGGAQMMQTTCKPDDVFQKFDIAMNDDGFYRITNIGSGKSLEIRDQQPIATVAIQQNDYFAKSYQEFDIIKRGDGQIVIQSRDGKMYVDVSGASLEDGALIQLWTDGSGMNEAWMFEPAP